MPKPEPPLLRHEKNIRSQAGEDGVLAYALSLLPARDRWCVEFGAWDGLYCSNTAALIEGQDYAALLIEADLKKFEELRANFAKRERVNPLCALVGFDGPNTLDNLLARTPIPKEFDLLSIDIDGCDYHVWDALKNYRPKLVVIEYNPTIANGVSFVPEKDMSKHQGCSLESLNTLARSKGYRLIHATYLNGIFVDEKYFKKFGIAQSHPADFRANVEYVTHLFQTYDGEILLSGNKMLLWHNIPLDARRMQLIPRFLRTHPSLQSFLQRVGWKLFKLWRKLTG